MNTHVELREVSKRFGDVLAVDRVSLGIRQGEVLTLLGPSGCGKTTTLNMIAGFLPPDGGSILIADRPVERVPPHRRNTGMVFQNYALFPHLTVFDNVAFGLEMRKVRRDEIRRRVEQALDLVKLGHTAARYPKQLSGGQQQRIALARALVIQPDVLLLDEPLSNLDAKLRQEMRVELVDIQKRVGITTVFVTHDQEEALAISDRLAVMRDGRVEQVGSPSDVYERPSTMFVARFIGESNTFRGTVREVGLSGTLVETAQGVRIHAPTAAGAIGREVEVLVRPEKMRLSREELVGPNTAAARLERVVYLGSSVTYLLDLDGESVRVSAPNVGADGFRPDDRVWLAWDAASVLTPEAGTSDG